MKFSEWKNYLCSWVNRCQFHKQPSTSLEDSDPDEFFANYLEFIRVHSSSSVALPSTDCLLQFLLENYSEFKFFLNDNGGIKCGDYVFVYSILLHNACTRKPCVQLTFDSSVEQHCFSQFLERMGKTKVLTRQALHMMILDIWTDDGKNVKDATMDDVFSIIDDSKTDELEIMASTLNMTEDSDVNQQKTKKLIDRSPVEWKSDQLSINDDCQLAISDDSILLISDESDVSIIDDNKLFINHVSELSIINNSKSSLVESSESFDDISEKWENLDDRVLVEWQIEELELRFHLAKESLSNGIRNANLLAKSLRRATMLFNCCSHNASHLLPQIRALRPFIDCYTDPGDYVLSRLMILMQKHHMQVPQFNQRESICIQILSVIDYNLSQSYMGNTQLEMRLEELQMKYDKLQENGEQSKKLLTKRNESLRKRLAKIIKMWQMLKNKLKPNAQWRKSGLVRKIVIIGFNAHTMLIKNLKMELGLKLNVNRKIGVGIGGTLICELRALIESKDLLIKELTSKHDQFIDKIKTKFGLVINLSKTDQSIEHLVICQLFDMVRNLEGQILDKNETGRNRLLQKLKVNFKLKFNQSEMFETAEDNIIDELKELIEKNLDKRFFLKIHMGIKQQLKSLKETLEKFCNTLTLAEWHSFKDEDTLKAMQEELNAVLLCYQNLEEATKLSAEKIANLYSECVSEKDEEIIKLNAQVNEQRKAAIKMFKTLKGTYKKNIDYDATTLDSDFCFRKLHCYLQSFCLSYKQLARRRNYLDKRSKFLARQLTNRSVSRGQLTPLCWNELDHLLNDLQASYDKVVCKILVARRELHKYSQASCDYAEWIDKLREEFTSQVNISAVQQLRELMVNSSPQKQYNEMISQQLMIKQLQLQLSRQLRDRKFAIKRLKTKLITCRRKSGRSVAQLRKLKQKLTIANKEIQLLADKHETHEPKVTNLLRQTRAQLNHAKVELRRVEQLLSLRDSYIEKLMDSRQLLQKQLLTKVGKIEDLRHRNKMLDTEGEPDQNEKKVLDFLQQENFVLQKKLKRSLEEMETSYILSLKYDLEESRNMLAIARQEVTDLQADLEHLKHSGSIDQLNSLDNDELKQSKNVAAVSPSRRRSKIPLKIRTSGSSQGEKKQQLNCDNGVPQPTTRTAQPPPPMLINTPQQVSEFYVLYDTVQARIMQREEQLRISQVHNKRLEAECAESKFLVESQFKITEELLNFQKWQTIKYVKTQRKNKELRVKVKKWQIKVYVAKRIQYHWSSKNGGSNLFKELEDLKLTNNSLLSDLQKIQKNSHKFSETNVELQSLINALEKQIEAKNNENDKLTDNLKENKLLANNLLTELGTLQKHFETLQSEKNQLHAQLAQSPKEASQFYKLEQTNNELIITLNLHRSKLVSLNDDYHNLQASFKENQTNLSELEVKYKQLEISLASREKEIEKLEKSEESDNTKVQETNDELSNALKSLEKRLESLESEKKALLEELEEARDRKWNYDKLEDANRELERISDTKDKRLEELENEKKELYEKLKKSEESKCDYFRSKDATSMLQMALNAHVKRLEELASEKKDLQEKLKKSEELKCDHLDLKSATSELQMALTAHEKRLEELASEKKDLQEKLKKSEELKCDHLDLKSATSELQMALTAHEKRLEELASEKKDLQEKLKKSEESKCDHLELRSATSVLQMALTAHEKRLKELESEKKDLQEKLKRSEEWKCDHLHSMITTNELQMALNAHEKRLKELESEKKDLQEKLKQSEEWKCDHLHSMITTNELQMALTAQEKRLKELESEKKDLLEKLKDSEEWQCDHLYLKDATTELQMALNAQEKQLEELKSEKKDLQEKLKHSEVSKRDYIKLKDITRNLQNELDAQVQLIKQLEKENANLQEDLRETEDWKCDCVKLKEANSDLQKALDAKEKGLKRLETANKALNEELKRTEERHCDYLKLKDANNELKKVLDGKETRLKKLEMRNKALHVEMQQLENRQCDCSNLKYANSELQNALNAQEEQLEKLGKEKKFLLDELKKEGDWKCNYFSMKETNSELLATLEAQEEPLAELEDKRKIIQVLENEKQYLKEDLKRAGDWKCRYLKLKEDMSELKNMLSALEKELEKSKHEKKFIHEKLKQALSWQCVNKKLRNELDDQNKLLQELTNERKELFEMLNQTEDCEFDYLELKDDVLSKLRNSLNAQQKRLEKLESEKNDLHEKFKQTEEWKCDLENALHAKQRQLEELENQKKGLSDELEELEVLKGDYLKVKDMNNELKSTLEAQEKRYERLQKKFEYAQTKQKQYRQRCQDYQKNEVSQTERESARRSQEQRLKMMQEEHEEQNKDNQSQNWEQKFRELQSTLDNKNKQLKLLQSGKQELEFSEPLVDIENQDNNSPTANKEFSKIQLRNVIEEQHERIKILQSEKNELNIKLGLCEQNLLELEKQNAAINYRMRKLDDSITKAKTNEQQNKQKELEKENTWLHLEIGRLNALVTNQDRHDYSLPLASSTQFPMKEIEGNINRPRNRSLLPRSAYTSRA